MSMFARAASCRLLFALAVAAARPAAGGVLAVQGTAPAANAVAAAVDGPITVTFSQPVDPASINGTSLRIFGRWSGAAAGVVTVAGPVLTFTPAEPFSAGETVTVNLSRQVRATDGSPLRSEGYAFRFWTATAEACWIFEELDTMSNYADPPSQTRIYGAAGPDLNNDGWLDITTVNEVSADLRVFLNRADGTGLFDPWLQPPAPGLFEMSPNEPGDFDNDGNTDLCVASTATGNVLIFLGNGDGTFQPAAIIPVGDEPLGIAVLDVDGDGDPDIVNGNRGADNLSLLVNNGAGVFAAPVFFEAGVSGEYGVAAADLDNDGIFDLAVGGIFDQTVGVVHGNGDGTFTPAGSAGCGGPVWQVGTGDVNGDGWEDVHTANSVAATGGILVNLGGGTLAAAVTYGTGGHTPATDLGDFDGDGDLDWLLSSFGGGLWRLYENNGDGTFTAGQDFTAPANPSCGTAMDLDNDRRLDVVLLDEIADVVVLMRNVPCDVAGDTDGDGVVGIGDFLYLLAHWGPCPAPCPPSCPADFDGDCEVDISDFLTLLANWSL